MRKRRWVRVLVLFLAVSLAGCGSNITSTMPTSETSVSTAETSEADTMHLGADEILSEEEAQKKAEEEAQKKAEEEAQKKAKEEAQKKAEEEAQKRAEEEARKKADSMSMLNYLTVVSQEINSSKNSRIYLESAYSSLINNTYPNAVDVRTEAYLEDLLDTLENYRMLSVKRDRLQYIYEQNRAKAMKEAIPNPIALLSAVQSGNYLKMAISVIYMAADSYANYTKYTEETDLQYLKDGWELDDEEAKEVHNSRSQTFSYMIDMVRNNTLPGDYALNETSVTDFVSWKMNTNVTRRIEFLESNQDVYKAFGEYWLVLAQSYYENNDYVKCLEAVKTYETIGSRIFRKDYDYAKVLPLAIVSMRETGSDQKYIAFAEEHLPLIKSNSDVSDWALNYFFAETYLDLYAKTNKKVYLQTAYDRQKSVVNHLIDEQKKLNEAFLGDIQEQPVDKKADTKKKKEVENYNKMLKEQRKTELPPISEPLYVNCQMLKTIANELGISQSEKNTINKMLTVSVYFFCRPIAPALGLGFLTHILLDYTNKNNTIMLICPPNKIKPLNLCPYDGIENNVLGALATMASIYIGVYFFINAIVFSNIYEYILLFFEKNIQIQGIDIPVYILYFLAVNLIAFIVNFINEKIYKKKEIKEEEINLDKYHQIISVLHVFDILGGSVGKLLAVLLVYGFMPKQGNGRRIVNLYIIPICILFSWLALFSTFFMRDMYPHIVLIPTEINGIQLKYIVLAVWLVINIITFVVLPKMDSFKKVFLRREKVALILSFLGGAAGGYLAIGWKEKHFNAVVLKRSMPFMAGMHAVVLTCVFSLGMIRLF